jgi:hypothetical protein
VTRGLYKEIKAQCLRKDHPVQIMARGYLELVLNKVALNRNEVTEGEEDLDSAIFDVKRYLALTLLTLLRFYCLIPSLSEGNETEMIVT